MLLLAITTAFAVSTETPPLAWPVEGRFTSNYGKRGEKHHDGIDISANLGTWVRSAEAGVIIFSGRYGNYGNLIVIRHKNGIKTFYAHLMCGIENNEERWCAFKGMRVRRLQKLARVGMTGRTRGPLHNFEVYFRRQLRNPLKWLPSRSFEKSKEPSAIGGP